MRLNNYLNEETHPLVKKAKQYDNLEDFIDSIIGQEKDIPQQKRPNIYQADIEGMTMGIKPYKKQGKISFFDNGDGIIVTVDGEEAGYISKIDNNQIDLSVAKEFQRKGIGKELSMEFFRRYPEMIGNLGGLTPQGKSQMKKQLTSIWRKYIERNR